MDRANYKLGVNRNAFNATVSFVRETIIKQRLYVHGLSICNLNTEVNKTEETYLIHLHFLFDCCFFQIVTTSPQAK